MGNAANYGGIGNVNSQQFPVLWLGTFAPRIAKVSSHAGATHQITHQ